MAKTTASFVLVVFVVTLLILNGYSAVEGEGIRGNQHEKDEVGGYNSRSHLYECYKLLKLCLRDPPNNCPEYYEKCKQINLKTAEAKSGNPKAESLP
jgi:hypothetical protein